MSNWIEKYHKLLLILILFLGFLLRGVEFLNGNYLFGFDQGRDYLLVREMVDNFKPRLTGAEVGAGSAGLSGLFHGPFYLYFLTIPFILFRGNPYGGLLLMFIFGFSTLMLCYIFSKRIFGKKGALLSTFLLAVSPTIAPQSRFLWNHHPSSFFIVIVLYLVYLIPKKPQIYFPLSLFFAGFIYNFELAIAIPLILSIFLYALFILRIKDLKTYIGGFFAVFLTFSPFILFELRHGFMGVKGIFNYLVKNPNKVAVFNFLSLKNHLIDYRNNALSTFLFDFFLQNIYLKLLFFGILFYFTISYLRNIRKKKIGVFISFLILMIMFTWTFFLLLQNNIWDYYLIHLHFAYIFLFVFVFLFLLRDKKEPAKKFILLILGAYLIFMFFGALKRTYLNYSYDFFDYGGGAKIRGKLAAIDYIYQDAGHEKFNVLVFMPPVYTYPYDYLFEWYGRKKYGYVPGKEKKGLFYLLIEPDPGKPWTYKGWQETVIKVGKVLKTEILSSGLIVEKRYDESKN